MATPGTQKKKKKKDEMRVQRKRVASEIIQTEGSYCKALHQIVAMYLLPLRQDGGLLSKKNLSIIFSNIESISSFHQEQLSAFERDPDHLGPSFQKLIPFLELYKEYCSNYGDAMEKLKEKQESSSKFANFLEKTRIEKQTLDLPSLLIQPIQRIPRYRLLVTELLKFTKESNSDHELLKEALGQIEEAANFVNESIREREQQEQLQKVQDSLVGKNVPDIVTPGRSLWREGVLVKMCRRELKRRYFFLFNDILIYTSIEESSLTDGAEYVFHRLINLDKCAVQLVEDTDVMQNAFQVLSNEKSFTVFAENYAVMQSWVQDIEDAIRQTQKQRFAESGASPTEVAPVWVPDKMQKTCTFCDGKFTAINRRHHCRRCGALCCGSCSGNNHYLENLGKSARVCDVCYEALTGQPVGSKRGSRRVSAAVPKDEYKRMISETESKQNLAKRATVLFGKGSTKSVIGMNTRRNSSALAPSDSMSLDTETESTCTATDQTDPMQTDPLLSQDGSDEERKKKRSKKKRSRSKKKKRSRSKKKAEVKPLEEWSSEYLEEWLNSYENGKFARFSQTFAGLSGADIAHLNEAQITAHVPGLFGSVLYNMFQLQKREALEAAAASAEANPDGEDEDDDDEEEEDDGEEVLAAPAHAPPPPPEEEEELVPPSKPAPKPLPKPPTEQPAPKPLPKPPSKVPAQVATTGSTGKVERKFPVRPPPAPNGRT